MFSETMEVVSLSSVKYSVGGLNFMDGRDFVAISVLKRGEIKHGSYHGKVADPAICL